MTIQYPQAIACQQLCAQLHGSAAPRTMQHPEQGLIFHITQGVMRWLLPLEAGLDTLTHKPIRHPQVRMLGIIGLYQLLFLTMPHKQVLYQSVQSCSDLKLHWAKGLINACLRRAIKEQKILENKCHSALASHNLIPMKLKQLIECQWPNDYEQIFAAWASPIALNIRLNPDKTSDHDFVNACHCVLIPSPLTDHAFIVDPATAPTTLPGFDQGHYYIQDIGAQLVPKLMALEPGMQCLDACCGKGGKTFHLHQHTPNASIIATDIQGQKSFENNQKRLGIDGITWQQHDWRSPHPTLKPASFDRILLDAPCSASGIVSRHPEILWKGRENNIKANQALQCLLLDQLWPLLKPNGLLLYTTCSLLEQENDQVIEHALRQYPDLIAEPIEAIWGQATKYGRQLLPSEHHASFYFASLKKNKSSI